MMNREDARRIAESVTMVRPDWLQNSIVNLLAEFRAKPARDVHLAMLWVAYDPASKTPGRLREDGPWWHLTAPMPASESHLFGGAPAHQLRKPTTYNPAPGAPPDVVAAHRDRIRQAAHTPTTHPSLRKDRP